jgi:2',3'-cyclic-nucleotide 2'-phosphodiesterase (5'-nucleotidase family)
MTTNNTITIPITNAQFTMSDIWAAAHADDAVNIANGTYKSIERHKKQLNSATSQFEAALFNYLVNKVNANDGNPVVVQGGELLATLPFGSRVTKIQLKNALWTLVNLGVIRHGAGHRMPHMSWRLGDACKYLPSSTI